jgi:hypothetical protein
MDEPPPKRAKTSAAKTGVKQSTLIKRRLEPSKSTSKVVSTKPIGWMDALKIWNSDHGQWCIPKKRSAEYQEIQQIRRGSKTTSVKHTTLENAHRYLYAK